MSIWEAYSEEFEDAYDRFDNQIDDDDTFNDIANKFNHWINEGRIMKGEPTIQPTLRQLQALAERVYTERDMQEFYVEIVVPDKRFKSGFRPAMRDIYSGKTQKYKKKGSEYE